jgi:hypothetical protein
LFFLGFVGYYGGIELNADLSDIIISLSLSLSLSLL